MTHQFEGDETRSGFGECLRCGEFRGHANHVLTDEGCSECSAGQFDDGACLYCGAGSDEHCDMNCGDDDDE